MTTGSSVVLSYENGCRHFVSCQPNNYCLGLSDIDLAMLSGAQHLLRADVWFSEPMLAGGNEQLLRSARAQGLATSLDINWDPQWGIADAATIVQRIEAVRRILPWVDLVHGNVRELNRFSGSEDLHTTFGRSPAGAQERLSSTWAPRRRLLSPWPVDRLACNPGQTIHEHDRHGRPVERVHDAAARL